MSARKSLTHDGRTQSIGDWSCELGIPVKRLYDRIRQGWSVDRVMVAEQMRGEKAWHGRLGYAWDLPNERRDALADERKVARYSGNREPKNVWDLPLEDDPWAQAAIEVATEEGGFTLDEIGHLMGGLSRERVRQVEEQALRKADRIARLRGHRGGIVELLQAAAAERDLRDESEKGGYDG